LCSGLCTEVLQLQRPEAARARPWQVIRSPSEDLQPQVVGIEDVDQDTPKAAKHIRIRCPSNVAEEIIDIESIPNGVAVSIGGAARVPSFKREFQFDYRTEGQLTLCEDECSFQNGVLLLSLRRLPQRRLRLGSLRGAAPAPMEAQEEEEVEALEVFPMTPTLSEAGSSSTPSSPSSDWYFVPEVRGTLLRRGLESPP